MSGKISWIRYVPHGFVWAYERDGWNVLPGYFVGDHHAGYSVAMSPGPDVKFVPDTKHGGLKPADPAERTAA